MTAADDEAETSSSRLWVNLLFTFILLFSFTILFIHYIEETFLKDIGLRVAV